MLFRSAGFVDGETSNYKKFHVRAWENFVKFIKAYGRLSGHEFATEKDVDYAYQILYNASYLSLLQDYGDVDLNTFEIQERVKLESIKAEGDRPINKNQLKRWIVKKLNRAENGEMETQEIYNILEKWKLNHLLEESITYLKGSGDVFEPRRGLLKIMK